MSDPITLLSIASKVAADVLIAANAMPGTVIGAAAFGGICLLCYYIYQYYTSFDKELISKEHVLAILMMVFGVIALPLSGVVFAGLYEIKNAFAAWQIGLTTPFLIQATCIAAIEKAKHGTYHKTFIPDEADA